MVLFVFNFHTECSDKGRVTHPVVLISHQLLIDLEEMMPTQCWTGSSPGAEVNLDSTGMKACSLLLCLFSLFLFIAWFALPVLVVPWQMHFLCVVNQTFYFPQRYCTQCQTDFQTKARLTVCQSKCQWCLSSITMILCNQHSRRNDYMKQEIPSQLQIE